VLFHKLVLDFASTPLGQGLSKNSFLDPNAQLIFSIDSAQQHIFNAKVLGAIDPAPAPLSNCTFGAVEKQSNNALIGHFQSK